LTEFTNVTGGKTDRQTDGRTPHDGIGCACITSHGNMSHIGDSRRIFCGGWGWSRSFFLSVQQRRYPCVKFVIKSSINKQLAVAERPRDASCLSAVCFNSTSSSAVLHLPTYFAFFNFTVITNAYTIKFSSVLFDVVVDPCCMSVRGSKSPKFTIFAMRYNTLYRHRLLQSIHDVMDVAQPVNQILSV